MLTDLDAWLAAWEGPEDYRDTVLAARNAIVGLRVALEAKIGAEFSHGMDVVYEIRAEVLEEAAAECDQMDRLLLGARECAAAIRALKDERHE